MLSGKRILVEDSDGEREIVQWRGVGLVWTENGIEVAVEVRIPVLTHALSFQRDSWEEAFSFKGTSSPLIVSFSPNGLYLASFHEHNTLMIWDVLNRWENLCFYFSLCFCEDGGWLWWWSVIGVHNFVIFYVLFIRLYDFGFVSWEGSPSFIQLRPCSEWIYWRKSSIPLSYLFSGIRRTTPCFSLRKRWTERLLSHIFLPFFRGFISLFRFSVDVCFLRESLDENFLIF